MEFGLSADQAALRDRIIEFSRETLSEGAAVRDREQTFPRELWREAAGFGLTALLPDEGYGGLGLDPLTAAIALEAFGYGCKDGGLVFSVCAHLLSCVVPIWKHGSELQKQRYLPGLCDGTLIGGNATTEPGSGSDAFGMLTRAEASGDGFILNGSKMFVSNGPVADVLLVYALTDRAKGYHGGITAFLVDAATDGMRASPGIEKMGLRTSPLGELALEDVYVPRDAVLGGVGGGSPIFVESMDWERALLFASHVGTMDRLLEQAIAYARTRRQFNQPIGKFQAVAHRIADVKVAIEAARLLAYRAAWRLGTGRSGSLDAAMAKLFVSEAYVATAMAAVQVHGGYGFTTEYDVERALRDSIGSTLYSGTSEMQRNIIARWLGL